MAKRGGGPRRPVSGRASGSGGRRGSASTASGARAPRPAQQRDRRDPGPSRPVAPPPGPFRLGAIPGSTPGRWIDTWRERMPETELVLVALAVAHQRRALADGDVDAALIRLPIDTEGLHVIPLYDELPVVVVPADSHLSAADELELGDLAGEIVITPRDDVLAVSVPGGIRPAFDPPSDTGEAIATVGAGVGTVIVPMSLARLHHRKDVEYRPLRGGPTSTVALAWPKERSTALVDTFVGIVRGRTANSSRT